VRWLAPVLGLFALAVPAHSDDATIDTPSHQPVPRWAMLKDDEVFARNGPSKDNTTIWTYRVASLPVQIISETRDWRLICDPEGNTAWVSKIMLRAQRTVMSPFTQKIDLYASDSDKAPVKAVMRPKALAQLVKCKKDWCKLTVGGVTGWAPRQNLWGTQATAACQRPNPFASHS
jgi:SH3-like domain-containing protein